jgi:hypothetical protein
VKVERMEPGILTIGIDRPPEHRIGSSPRPIRSPPPAAGPGGTCGAG